MARFIFCVQILSYFFVVNLAEWAVPTANAAAEPEFPMSANENVCVNNPKRPFYQRSDGVLCCRGRRLPYITITPEVTGECAVSTKTDANGILNAPSMWCAYSCTLQKMGLVTKTDEVIPDKFFAYLTQGINLASKTKLKLIMEKYLNCYKPLKNPTLPCYSSLGFHKCFKDALQYICTTEMPTNNDFSQMKKPVIEYQNLTPFCSYNNRRVMPGCCHGRPLPWTITEILEAPRNATKKKLCDDSMGAECDGTCYLSSIGAVNEAMEIDVDKFSKSYLQYFPAVQPSGWMYFAGPTFLFYDELIGEIDGYEADSVQRVCMFHDEILQLHATKVEQYCNMKPEEVAALVKANAAETAKNGKQQK